MTVPLQSALVTVKGREGFYWALSVETTNGVNVIDRDFAPYTLMDGYWDHDAIIARIERAIAALPGIATNYVELLVFNRGLRERMIAAQPTGAPIVVMPASECAGGLPLYTEALAHIEGTMQPELHPDYAPAQPVDIIRVHTDGSAGRGRKTHVGFGWVSDNGRYGFGAEQGAQAHVGELWAIAHALDRLVRTPANRIVVHCDSAGVIDMAKAILSGQNVIDGYDRATRRPLRRIAEHRARVIDFQWVRGHDGDASNETADRLAVLGRRTQEANLTMQSAAPRARTIVEELHAPVRPMLAVR